MTKRTKKLTVRMTEEEWQSAQRLAEALDRPLAVAMREWAIGKGDELKLKRKPKKIIHLADPELIREVAKIGNNLNQMARALNLLIQKNKFSASEAIAPLSELAAIERDLKELLEFVKDAR